MEFILPVVLISFAITGTGDSARIRVCFPQIKEVKKSFIVWLSKDVAREYGVSNPVLPQDLGDMLSNSTYAKIIGGLVETPGLNCLKVEGSELRFNCSALPSTKQGILLSRLVRRFGCDLSQITPTLFGWSHLPACVGRLRSGNIDGDLDAVYDRSKDLASYVILHTGWSGSDEPILRCAATYRKEAKNALDDKVITPWMGMKYS
ncbi:hypothetical protein MBO12_02230 [Candidatus Saccharibacteria bacterium]|nr:hypothetical protein [Candidatus Saccharibacteria bacterium]